METKKYKLKDLLQIKNGKDYKEFNQGNIPVYGSGGIITYINKSIYNGESVLLPRKGSLSNIQYASGEFWTVDTIYWTIINKKLVLPKFLYYYLSLLDLSKLDSGSTLPSMTFDSYYNIYVFLPSLEIQEHIINMILPIENKINNNNRINDNLSYCNLSIY
ncbi:MAG: restriction endonuclease subunit S [Bacilli bacterium]